MVPVFKGRVEGIVLSLTLHSLAVLLRRLAPLLELLSLVLFFSLRFCTLPLIHIIHLLLKRLERVFASAAFEKVIVVVLVEVVRIVKSVFVASPIRVGRLSVVFLLSFALGLLVRRFLLVPVGVLSLVLVLTKPIKVTLLLTSLTVGFLVLLLLVLLVVR
mmetsp:Transcript_25434/g.29860  ORF Transcript_25434/g.29860 Transcript_25434/m.29860 type:complete len:160 (-) Transcript_25434:24-503(-)